jgi:hypothetical protein
MKNLVNPQKVTIGSVVSFVVKYVAYACLVYIIAVLGYLVGLEEVKAGKPYMDCSGVLVPIHKDNTVTDLFIVRTIHVAAGDVAVTFPINQTCSPVNK